MRRPKTPGTPTQQAEAQHRAELRAQGIAYDITTPGDPRSQAGPIRTYWAPGAVEEVGDYLDAAIANREAATSVMSYAEEYDAKGIRVLPAELGHGQP